jgi:hypothetical protein
MDALSPKIERERATIEVMLRLYCQGNHQPVAEICDVCGDLMAYAEQRLRKCPFQEEKPPCADCPIHCYQPKLREQVRQIMRYAGPRMFFRHPIFTVRHWLDGLKKTPPHPKHAHKS